MKLKRLLLIGFTILMLVDFIGRGVFESWSAGKNDFSDPYCGAWLWRHGQNPYDSALATAANISLTRTHLKIVPVYPLTTYVLTAPLSLVPWHVANVVWAILGTAGVALMAFSLVRLLGCTAETDVFWLVVGFVFAFAPFHTAVHGANVVVICLALCMWAVYLASTGKEIASGVALAVSIGLKPQLGFWILLFYLLQRRWRLFMTVASIGIVLLGIALVRVPMPVTSIFRNYTENLHYWFGPGGQNDFTAANPLRFQLINAQVVLYPLVRTVLRANVLSGVLWLSGTAVWFWVFLRAKGEPETLALTSFLALSLIPFYHRSYDLGLLVFALCWCFGQDRECLKRSARVTFLLLLILLLPGQSVIFRTQSLLPGWVSSSLWWNVMVAPYAVWTLLALNLVLLHALLSAGRIPLKQADNERLAPAIGASPET
jgi:hypothetical protein